MPERTAATPPSAALHLPTVIAIAVVAYALANVAHEGLGHGGMCVALGGEPRVLNAVYFDCGRRRVELDAASRWISAGGTLVNLALAGLTALLLRGANRAGSRRAVTSSGSFWRSTSSRRSATGCSQGSAGSATGNAVVAGSPHYTLWRIALAVVGTASYLFVAVPVALRGLEPFFGSGEPERLERARRFTLPAYFTGGALYVSAGLLNPESPLLVLISAAAASFGGASALAWMTQLLRNRKRYPPKGEPVLSIAQELALARRRGDHGVALHRRPGTRDRRHHRALSAGSGTPPNSLAQHPGGHRTLVLDDGGLERIEELSAEPSGERPQDFGVHQVALTAVRAARSGRRPRDETGPSNPMVEASRQKKSPPGASAAQDASSMARKWSGSRAKCSTALQITTSAPGRAKLWLSTASWRKLSAGSCGANSAASLRTAPTAAASPSTPATS